MTLGLRDIEYFVAVAEHGNLGRAAEALGLSQPALSKSLRRMEVSMQTKLVRKIPKGIELTTVGSAFLAHVGRIRLSLNDVAREVADLTQGRSGHVRLGCGPDMIDLFVQSACSRLLAVSPKVTLSVTMTQNDALFPAVRNGEFDLILSGLPAAPYPDLVHEQLLDDPFVVYAAANHSLARRKRVTLADLVQEEWVLSNPSALSTLRWTQTFARSGLQAPKVTMSTNSHTLMLHMVASSNLLGFMPRWYVRRGGSKVRLVELPIEHPDWSRRGGISYRKDAYLSPAAQRFINLIKQRAETIGMH
jgi:DNA-binding transcriptional LysR family regulator